MTITEARARRERNRKKIKVLQQEVNELMEFIVARNADPSVTATRRRNERIYAARKAGKSWEELAQKYNLKAGTVKAICNSMRFKAEYEG